VNAVSNYNFAGFWIRFAAAFIDGIVMFALFIPVVLTVFSFGGTAENTDLALNGLFLIGCTVFLVICVIIKKISNKSQLRNGLALLGGTIIAGIVIVSSNVIALPTFRHLNAANPFLITTDILTDSVSEHATTTADISFFFFSILMIFGGIGAWILFQKKVIRSLKIKDEMAAFALIIGFLGIYFSSAFVRLEVLGAISVIILSSIGVAILISKILKEEHKPTSFVTKISFLAIIVALLMVPMVYPEKLNWSNNNMGIPNSLLHSGSSFDISTNDWPDAMQWLKENTPKDATIAAWWDYGYWISTLSERKSLADNATVLDWQIRKLASMYMSTPDDAWKILMSDTETNVGSHYVTLPSDARHPTRHLDGVFNEEQHRFQEFDWWKENYQLETTYDPDIIAKYSTLYDYWISEVYVIPPVITGLDADYVMVNLALRKLSEANQLDLYTIRQDGADETKAYWFMKIADLRVMDYYNPELKSYTDKFWNETLLGSLIPFTPVLYVDPDNPERQSETFKPGYVAIYVKNVKFPPGGQGPFELVYIPPSFERDATGPLTGPIIYKINKEYNTNQ